MAGTGGKQERREGSRNDSDDKAPTDGDEAQATTRD